MRRPSFFSVLLFVVALLFVVPSAVRYYTDWLWFKELGYESIFLRTLNAQTFVFAGTFAVAFLFLYFNLQARARDAAAAAHRARHERGRPARSLSKADGLPASRCRSP